MVSTESAKRVPLAGERPDRYRVSVEEYVRFRTEGFLAVRGLVSQDEVAELRGHTDDLMAGNLPEQQLAWVSPHGHKLDAPPAGATAEQRAAHFLRIHMLHRLLAFHERYMLHPRVIDVVSALTGPDVLAMQTMLFIKAPGGAGQGWHQDTFYIPTSPDTLIGAWIAIDDCDEYNGAMWFARGSQVEPVYPPDQGYGSGDVILKDINRVKGTSNEVDAENDLSRVADKYPQVLVKAKAGDVVFFGGHVLHRSKKNITTDRFRRSFVSHYCNARSFTQWGAGSPASDPHASPTVDPVTGMTNGSHILARGDTHLPFAKPPFGTPCAASLTPEQRKAESDLAMTMMADKSGDMMPVPANPNQVDE